MSDGTVNAYVDSSNLLSGSYRSPPDVVSNGNVSVTLFDVIV